MKHTLLSILAALLLSLCGLALILGNITDPGLMQSLMERYAPPDVSRLPAEEYQPVATMIDRYLHGDTPVFQHIFTVNGMEYAAFNQKEQQHMADVQGLFRLCNSQVWAFLTIVPVALIAAFHLFSDERTLRTFRRTLIAILAAVTIIIIAACIDFNSLFVLFHKVAFTNDLWLLNPQTDLLIRLMPIEFFVSYAAIIGGLWLLGMVGLLVFATYCIKKKQDKGE
jgi:integral membrane protein (TIGR01906 family)